VLHGEGWWRRADRFIAKPVVPRTAVTTLAGFRPLAARRRVRRSSSAARAARSAVRSRRSAPSQHRLPPPRTAPPWTSPTPLGRAAIARWKPVGDRQRERLRAHRRRRARPERCMRENALGPAVLAEACAGAGIRS
jgi:dTDP-4-dehydrorhamnose reductase